MPRLHHIATTTATALSVLLCSSGLSHADDRSRDWSFVDLAGKKHAPFDSQKTKALVAVFIAPDCPIANYFQPTLREMAEKYAARGVVFVLLHPDPELTAAAAKKHAEEYSITIPVALDPQQELAKRLKAEFTPEAFVIDKDGVVRYRGRVNDMYIGYGKKRRAPSSHDLDDAIAALVDDRKITNPKTKPIGCHIYYPEAEAEKKAKPEAKSNPK